MAYRADLAVHDSNGRLLAIVEVMNAPELDRATAIEIHKNLTTHYGLPDAPYYLLVSQDAGYLWDHPTSTEPEAPPTLEFSMLPIIERYAPDVLNRPRIHSAELEYVILQWLIDLISLPAERMNGTNPFIESAEFLQALRYARVGMGSPV